MVRVQPSQRAAASCDSAFTGSKDALCIQPSVLDMSVNTKMCEPCPSCRMVVYIHISGASSYNRFPVPFWWNYPSPF